MRKSTYKVIAAAEFASRNSFRQSNYTACLHASNEIVRTRHSSVNTIGWRHKCGLDQNINTNRGNCRGPRREARKEMCGYVAS